MSELYWAQKRCLSAELETILCGPSGDLLQKWQKKALRKAIKLAKKYEEKGYAE